MPEQSKFENVDLFAFLEAIMKQNTGFYQSDLDIDKEIIAKAAASPHPLPYELPTSFIKQASEFYWILVAGICRCV